MKYSTLIGKTSRQKLPGSEVVSHQLLLRAGFITPVAAGIYTFLPLGFRVLEKIDRIIKEELEKRGEILPQNSSFYLTVDIRGRGFDYHHDHEDRRTATMIVPLSDVESYLKVRSGQHILGRFREVVHRYKVGQGVFFDDSSHLHSSQSVPDPYNPKKVLIVHLDLRQIP